MNGTFPYLAAGAQSAWRRLREESSGQDLIEYAMLAGFIGVACAALIPYSIAAPISKIFDALNQLLMTKGNAG